jgi:hypothetical protein
MLSVEVKLIELEPLEADSPAQFKLPDQSIVKFPI